MATAVTRVDCLVCTRRIALVYHGSGRPRKDGRHTEAYLGVHVSDSRAAAEGGNESLCPGTGRWVPSRERVTA